MSPNVSKRGKIRPKFQNLLANETLYQLSYTPLKIFPVKFYDQLRTKTIELDPDSASEKTHSDRECATVHSKLQIKRSGVSLRVCYSYYPDFNFEIKSDDRKDLPEYAHPLPHNGRHSDPY